MRKLLITITLLTFCVITEAKKYPFDMKHQYRVEQIRVAEDGGRLIKAWGVASNADKAIIQIKPTAKEFEFVETNLNKLVQMRKDKEERY